jgi:hypothetical protein
MERLVNGEWITMKVIAMPKSGKARTRTRVIAETGSLFMMSYQDMGRVVKTLPEDQMRMSSFRYDQLCRAAMKCGEAISASCVAKVGDYGDDVFAFIFDDDDRLVEARLRYC